MTTGEIDTAFVTIAAQRDRLERVQSALSCPYRKRQLWQSDF